MKAQVSKTLSWKRIKSYETLIKIILKQRKVRLNKLTSEESEGETSVPKSGPVKFSQKCGLQREEINSVSCTSRTLNLLDINILLTLFLVQTWHCHGDLAIKHAGRQWLNGVAEGYTKTDLISLSQLDPEQPADNSTVPSCIPATGVKMRKLKAMKWERVRVALFFI